MSEERKVLVRSAAADFLMFATDGNGGGIEVIVQDERVGSASTSLTSTR